MDFIEFKLWKLLVLAVIAFIWGAINEYVNPRR